MKAGYKSVENCWTLDKPNASLPAQDGNLVTSSCIPQFVTCVCTCVRNEQCWTLGIPTHVGPVGCKTARWDFTAHAADDHLTCFV